MSDDRILQCSFCGKNQHEVRKLIAGPTVFICNECVELCSDILREEHKALLVKARDGVPDITELEKVLAGRIGGQEDVKQVLSLVVHSHYRRMAKAAELAAPVTPPTHVLLCGPSLGRGEVVRALEHLLHAPFVVIDATALIEMQQVRDVSRSVVYELLHAADFNTDRAEHGFLYVEDFDLLGRTPARASADPDAAGTAVQKALAGLMAGAIVDLDMGPDNRFTVATHAMTFICAGTFFGLAKTAASGGGPPAQGADAGDRGTEPLEAPLQLSDAEATALAGCGLLPDLVCHLSAVAVLEGSPIGCDPSSLPDYDVV